MKNLLYSGLVAAFVAVLVLGPSAAGWASVEPELQPHIANVERPSAHDKPFSTPDSLTDYVSFWRNVYAYWRLNQIVLHDTDIPGLIHEVIDLDSGTKEILTNAQRDYIDQRRQNLEQRIRHIAKHKHDPASLSEADQAMLQRIFALGGEAGVDDAAQRVRAQRGLRERFYQGLEASGKYEEVFRGIFRDANLPEDLAYIPHVESSFQNHARSSVGATGMWQFTRAAGRIFSLKVNNTLDQRLDPVASARGAARYFRQSYEQLGDWALAVTSYNHGLAGMMRAKSQFGTDFGRVVREYKSRTFGFASRNFYAEFLAAREIAREPVRYFPEGVNFETPLSMYTVVLDRPSRPRELAATYGVEHKDLIAMNAAWSRRVVKNDAALPAGTEVWLPAGATVVSKRGADVKKASAKTRATADAVNNAAAATAATELTNELIVLGVLPDRGVATNTDTISSVAAAAPYHVVGPDESLASIAKRYNLSVSVLRDLNGLQRTGRRPLRVGQRVRIREEAPSHEEAKQSDVVVHVVRKGDNPYVIAANYGVRLSELLSSNQLTKHSILRPGMKLGIPVSR